MTLLHPVKLYWSQNAASREVIALLSIEYKAATCSWTSSKNTNYMYIEYACMSLMSISFTKYSDKYWVTDFSFQTECPLQGSLHPVTITQRLNDQITESSLID